MPYESEYILADWTRDIQPSAMQKSLAFADDPDFISFALGLPDCNLFPRELLQVATEKLLSIKEFPFQYSRPLNELKQQIVEIMKRRGVICSETEIFLTAGAQQGINLLTRLLLNQGDKLIVENLAYPGFIQAVEPFRPHFLTVRTDLNTGLEVADVEKALMQKPSLIYLVPDGGNPHASSLSLDKRKQLAEFAQKYRIPILEDDPYGFFSYDDNFMPPIKSFMPDWVFYIGTFSKLLAPSLRVGWLIVPEVLHKPLSILKEGSDINIATFSQRLSSKILDLLSFDQHLNKLNSSYIQKRDVMFEMLKKYFPKESIIRKPSSGLLFWVQLPDWIETEKLFEIAVSRHKVAFIPGNAFVVNKSFKDAARSSMRINFSHSSLEDIELGVKRLAEAIDYYKAVNK